MINETPNEISTTNSRGNNKMKKFTKLFKNQKGLTLIELLAVIVILAIVAAIAVPAIGNIIDNSRDKAILADATTILSGAKLAATSGDCSVTTTTTTCDKAALTSYVEGITQLGTVTLDYSAVKDSTGWTVTFTNFAAIKNQTKYAAGVTSNKIAESALNTNLKK